MRRSVVLFSCSLLAGGVAWSCAGDDTLVTPLDAGGDSASVDGSVLDGSSSDGSIAKTDAATDSGAESDASDAGVDRGPTTIPFSGDPAGLFWEYGTHGGLYVADQANSAIVKWTDAAGFGTTWALPAPANPGSALGQLVRELDGTMFVPRAGTGTDNTILWITNLGDAGDLSLAPDASLDPTFTRQGFTLLPDNTTIDTHFKNDGVNDIGAAATFSLPPTEKNRVTGLSKPLAVVYNQGKLFVADGDLGQVFSIGQTGGALVPDGGDGGDAGQAKLFASIDQPSFACAGADGELFVSSTSGTVYRISVTGAPTAVATGLKQLRGVAFDGAGRRLFVAEHDSVTAGHDVIRIYPIN